jgi:hypothetical protein
MRQSRLPLVHGLPLLATLIATSAAAIPVTAEVVDWSSASSGTANGVSVSFSGGTRALVTDAIWVNKLFNAVNSYGLFSTAEGIEFSAAGNGTRSYAVSFSAPVTGVVMHLGSLASTITFDRSITKLSGQSIFQVAGNSVAGITVNDAPYSDANGSIALGDLQTFSFTVGPYFPSGEGIGMQLVINALPPVPEPDTWVLMLSGVIALGAWVRRRTTA